MSEKRFAVVGMGLSGKAAKRLLESQNLKVATFDDATAKEADFHDATQLQKDFQPTSLVVSPGYPLSSGWIKDFKARGGKLTCELDLAGLALKGEKLIGVTGSLGKSTTVSLVEAALRAQDVAAVAVGNIGYPLADYVCDVEQGKRNRALRLVVELSSYQLESVNILKFEHSAITYLSENHLDRYPNINDYYASKWKLLELTSGTCVLNTNGGDLKSFAAKQRNEKTIFAQDFKPSLSDTELKNAALMGAHNRDNLKMAWTLAELCGLGESAKSALLAYKGLPHRLESIGSFGNRIFINDSKATTMESVLTAVAATRERFEKSQIWLLLGGKDKNLPWEKLSSLKNQANLSFLYFGKCAALAHQKSTLPGPEVENLASAMNLVKNETKPGDVVLLSPGGSSLDEFKNFEERGLRFAQQASTLFS